MENFFFKIIKKVTNFKKTETIDNKNASILEDNIIRFTYFSCAINKKDIEIINSLDEIGSYYKNKLLLPAYISLANNKKTNDLLYIYKIVFSLTSKKLNFYLPENKNSTEYVLLASILTVKKIHKIIFLEYPEIKRLTSEIYKLINSKRDSVEKLTGNQLLLELILKKLTYHPLLINIFLKKEEKYIIYEIENKKITTQKELISNLGIMYKKITTLQNKTSNVKLNLAWGYLHFKKYNKNKAHLNIHKNIKRKTYFESKKETNSNIETIELTNKKNKTQTNLLFEYKETVDEYSDGNKDTSGINENNNELNIINELNVKNCTRSNIQSNSILKADIINNILINNKKEKDVIYTKKFIYDEWDYKKNKYKKNWCSVFQERYKKNTNNTNDFEKVDRIIKEKQKDITLFKEKLRRIFNLSKWKNRQISGTEIDYDSLIDNYKNILKNSYEKVYKYKKNINTDITILILIDSSLSTDSSFKKERVIDSMKNILLFISSSFDNIIENFLIASFYSNTRHDCRYTIIKDFKDHWKYKKYTITKINPQGYTRIGPAIRHSIQILKKIKTKEKLIILISDGKPTDYDEYEGIHGISDVKHAILEANKKHIKVKSIITDHITRAYLPSMLGLKNYSIVSDDKTLSNKILKLIYNSIKT
ncbi:MAG TPA: hypothetical protein V7791_01320 [Candidatus Azoamicus sp. OHIO1]